MNLKFHGRLDLQHLSIGRLFEALRGFGRYGAKPKIALLHVLGNNSAGVAARDFVHPLGFCSRRILGCHENIWKLDPNLNPLPSIRTSIRTSITQMKIHDPFTNHEDPWTLSAMDSASELMLRMSDFFVGQRVEYYSRTQRCHPWWSRARNPLVFRDVYRCL